MLSRRLVRFAGIAIVCLAMCAAASAQYGGGGATGGSGGTGGSGAYTPPSGGYSSGKAIGIGAGVAAGAAVGIALLVRHHRHAAEKTQAHTYVTGCTQSIQDGISVTNEKDNQTYSIVSASKSLQAGERMTLKGNVVATDESGNPAFQVQSLIKDYGTCGSASASYRTYPILGSHN